MQKEPVNSARVPTTALSAFQRGIYDACAIPSVLITIYGSKTIQTALVKCFLLTGCIFLGSILLMDFVIVPLVSSLSASLLPSTAVSVPGEPTNTPQDWAKWIGVGLWRLYYVFWVYPVYAVSFVLNSMWYQTIADRAYSIVYGKAAQTPATYDWFLKRVATDIYRAVLLLNYVLVTSLVYSFLPYPLGHIASFPLFAWLVAFVSFEYKWVQKGWTLEKRIDYFEARWSYFLGFGLPCTILTFFFPSFISFGVYAIVFPMYIIMANQSHPLPRSEELKRSNRESGSSISANTERPLKSIPIFATAIRMSDVILYLICGSQRQRRSSRTS